MIVIKIMKISIRNYISISQKLQLINNFLNHRTNILPNNLETKSIILIVLNLEHSRLRRKKEREKKRKRYRRNESTVRRAEFFQASWKTDFQHWIAQRAHKRVNERKHFFYSRSVIATEPC